MNEHRCWRCGRSLNVEKAPKDEAVLRCQRCKASNVVQEGAPASDIDKTHTRPQELLTTK